MVRMLFELHEEGAVVCRAMEQRLDALPGARPPCSEVDHVAATGWTTSRITYEYADGELDSFALDHRGDGEVEDRVDCSVLGKILAPLTNHALWSARVGFAGLSKDPPRAETVLETRRPIGTTGASTQVRLRGFEGIPASAGIIELRSYDADGQLFEQVRKPLAGPEAFFLEYDYDDRGNFVSRRATVINYPETLTTVTRYSYACWN